MGTRILIIGATSAIAQEVAKRWANKHHQLYLVARNEVHLKQIAADLSIRSGQPVNYSVLDLNQTDEHENLLVTATKQLGDLDIVLIAYGSLADQQQCQNSFAACKTELETNFVSVVSLLMLIANRFEKQKKGCIAVISSVAGDRGRKTNYIYGAAKAGLTVFLQGLRQRLHSSNVNVLTIKPGFVDTPMTKDFKKGMIWAKPDYVAQKIVQAVNQKRNVIYVPAYWRFIMLVIKLFPERFFKRFSF